MAKEQEEAIDYVQKQIDYFKEQIKFIEAVDSDYYDEEYGLYKNRVKQFETVLNMLKEKDKQINSKNGAINALQCALKERTEERDRKDNIMARQRKQIDLIINFIYEIWCKYPGSISHKLRLNGFNDDECGTCENTNRNCIECLKQYFENKVKE